MPLRKTAFRALAAICVIAVLLFAPLPWQPMTRIHSEVTIQRPPAEVFAYVSTPATWPAWHPSSLAVRGATDHPLEIGEEVTEDFRVAGREGTVVWKVAERRPPTLWRIDGTIDGRKAGTVTYALTPSGTGTRFEREFTYQAPTLLFSLLNWAALRKQVDAESTEAVRRLKAKLDGGARLE
ncbi:MULTISPECIES: SRPBCC family protein [unclassified Cupriavidus]|uniref:SRPBCC family protein n=1 Tax=unclassified Cupriavidus TaxID=2640874 RepID=UPI001AE87EB3|nr:MULTISPECIES: SRPBCC family protein [unclassified Cupriavidus]MBP0628208.1 SRPBCC family protein [Cupriavidus sp. AcVe19-1a]MBP0636216.1 SRPBCC family protein [Cupriavidus sp. AcVe19-6a]